MEHIGNGYVYIEKHINIYIWYFYFIIFDGFHVRYYRRMYVHSGYDICIVKYTSRMDPMQRHKCFS